MVEPLAYKLNDIVEMKKPHACGTNAWKVTRVGADIKLLCTNCTYSGNCRSAKRRQVNII